MNHLLKRESLAFILCPCSDECQFSPSSFSLRPRDRSGFGQALVKLPPEVGIGVRTISETPKEKD